ncbi:MAG TPA: phosphatase PAP2 family protein [Gaiellaceae bacterium]
MSRRSAALVAFACAFAALAGLVAAGSFTRIDQWAVDHAMPGGSFHHTPGPLINGLVPLLHAGWGTPYAIAANIITLPASFLIALAIVFACSRVLAAALVAAVAVEVLCKEVLDRPALYDHAFHISAFDSSFPSGHALRTMLVAGALAWKWPRARLAAAPWALVSVGLLELAGWHTPSDLAPGVVLAGLALLGARRLAGRS